MICELLILIFVFIFTVNYFKNRHNSNKIHSKLPPGPFGVPLFGYLPFLGAVPCQTITKLSKKWGPIFTLKLGQYPVVFINDFDKIKELYKLDAMTGRAQLEIFAKRGVYGLGLLEGEDWKEVRRFLLRCLRDFGFGTKSMESSIQDEVVQAIGFMKKNVNHPLYLKPFLEVAVINALWYLLTSEKYDIEDPTKKKVAEIMSEGLSDQNIVGISAFLPWLSKLLPNFSGYNKALKYFEAPEELAREIIEKHVKTHCPGEERDFIDHALTKIYNTVDAESMFYKDVGRKNLHFSLIDLFFAGSDTLSSTLGWTFLYLSIWPEKQARVQMEIDRIVGKERLPCIEDRTKMPYTEATMCEVMRMSTLTPLGLFHKALEDIPFEEHLFPKGTFFLANLYHVFKDEEYWGDPEVFRPERFLTEDGKFQKDERLIPFFTGQRTCPGKSLAMIEFFLFATGILQNFEFSLNPEEPTPYIGPRSGFIICPPKHKLIVVERQILKD